MGWNNSVCDDEEGTVKSIQLRFLAICPNTKYYTWLKFDTSFTVLLSVHKPQIFTLPTTFKYILQPNSLILNIRLIFRLITKPWYKNSTNNNVKIVKCIWLKLVQNFYEWKFREINISYLFIYNKQVIMLPSYKKTNS